jgi:2-dehydro-3-deoxygluconokinase
MRKRDECRWDVLSLGEVMLRFDPGEGRIHTTRSFQVWEGGGEYNVARSLRRCFGLRAAIATALADNPVGRLVEDLILQGGVDASLLCWRGYDGVGREVRNGFNFVERGFGPRAALGCSDRGHTAISQVQTDTWDWEQIFRQDGVRCLHTGGIFAALGDATPEVAKEAMRTARAHGTLVSYDLNYRPSLWQSFGGNARAREVNSLLVREADVLFAGEQDLSERLGVDLSGAATGRQRKEEVLRRALHAYPNLRAIAMTERAEQSAGTHHWGACAVIDGTYVSVEATEVAVLDRIGGGDSFAAGLLYGLLEDKGAEWAVRCGVAHGALAMTTPGDTSMATLREVERAMQGDALRTTR